MFGVLADSAATQAQDRLVSQFLFGVWVEFVQPQSLCRLFCRLITPLAK